MALFDFHTSIINPGDISGTPGASSSITAVGFQPKGLIAFGIDTVPNTTARPRGFWGICDEALNQYSSNWYSATDYADTRTIFSQNNSRMFTGSTFGGAAGSAAAEPINPGEKASVTAMTPTGFNTLTDLASVGLVRAGLIAIGGTGVSVQCGEVTLNTIDTIQDITVPGMTPDVVLFFAGGLGTNNDVEWEESHVPMWGCADGTNQYVSCMWRQSLVLANAFAAGFDQSASHCIVLTNPSTGLRYVDARAELGANTIRLTKDTMPAANTRVFYMAIQGVQSNIGSVVTDEAPGATKAVTGIGFQPSAGLFMGPYQDTPTSAPFYERNTINIGVQGNAVGAGGDHWAISYYGWTDPAGTRQDDATWFEDDTCFITRQEEPRVTLEAFRIESWDADGFTLLNIFQGAGRHVDQEVPFLLMAAGSNNNSIALSTNKRGSRCFSDFQFSFGEYGICGDSSHPELACIEHVCTRLSPALAISHQITYDLGTNFTDDFDIADTLVLGGFKYFLNLDDPITVRVQTSQIGFFFPIEEEEVFVVTMADLVGVDGLDWVANLDDSIFTADRQFWRVVIETSVPTNAPLTGASLGKAISLEHSPKYPAQFRMVDRLAEAARAPWEIRLNIDGIIESQKSEFDQKLLTAADISPVWLLDYGDAVLLGHGAMKAMLTRQDTTMRKSSREYNLQLRFEELV